MNLLFLSGDFPPKPGGIGVYGAELARAVSLRPEVERTTLLALGSWEAGSEKEGRLGVIRWPRGSLPGQWLATRAVIKRLKPDLVHVLTLFPEGLWASFSRNPYLVSLYGTEVSADQGRRLTRWAKGRTIGRAAGILPISRATAAKAETGFGLDQGRLEVVTPGLPVSTGPTVYQKLTAGGADRAEVRERLGMGPHDLVVMTLTRLVARKGVDDLIKALAGLPAEIKLLVVGEGPDRARLEGLVKETGLEARVRLTGYVERTGPYFKAADVFALASREEVGGDVEGFGIVLLEAQAFGLPVIGTSSGGIPEAFIQDSTGLLVPPGRPKELARAIQRLAQEEGLREALGAAGPELVRRAFDWSDRAAALVRIYSQVLRG